MEPLWRRAVWAKVVVISSFEYKIRKNNIFTKWIECTCVLPTLQFCLDLEASKSARFSTFPFQIKARSINSGVFSLWKWC